MLRLRVTAVAGAGTSVALALGTVQPVAAHEAPAAAPTITSLLTVWVSEPLPWLAVACAAGAYLWGVRLVVRSNTRVPVPMWRVAAFLAGLLVILVALTSWIDVYADDLLTVHMIQHLLLSLVAPPLLALGAPGTLALRASSVRVRRQVLLPILHSRLVGFLTMPFVAWSIFAIVLVAIHFSPIYDAALEDPRVHDFEHILFLVSGILFWWPIVAADPIPHRMHHGARLAYLLAMIPIGTAVALAIYFAPTVLYAHYTTTALGWGPGPLIDQQVAGLVMWAAGDLLLIGAAALVLGDWALADERRSRILDARRAAGIE